MATANEQVVHLDDANIDVTLSFTYGDLRKIEDAGNATIKIDEDTGKRRLDGSYFTARRTAMLSTIAKGITLDAIDQLSPRDGQKLFAAVAAAFNEATAVNDPKSPKESTSKKR
jgi:hypothetical protein